MPPSTHRANRIDPDDLVRLYLDDIGRHPLLTKDDEVDLAQLIEEGLAARAELRADPPAARRRELEETVRSGDRARRDFINGNLRLVVSVAKRYQGTGVPLLDLVQEGNIGLVRAVEKFDWRKGFKFSTYATWWIRQAIQRGVATSRRTIRLPVHAEDRLRDVLRMRDLIEAELGRTPTATELAEAAEVPLADVLDVLQASAEIRSLSAPAAADSDREIADVLADASALDPSVEAVRSGLAAEVERLLRMLDANEREVLMLSFGLSGGEAREIGDIACSLDLPAEVVRRLRGRGLAKLRHPAGGYDAADLLAS